MRTLVLLLLLMPPAAIAATLDQAIAGLAPGDWIEYEAALVAGGGSPCCIDWHGGKAGPQACSLESRQWNFSSDADRGDTQLRVFARRGSQGTDRIRAVGASCPVDTGAARVTAIRGVDGASAAGWIAAQVPALEKRERDNALAALALHAGPVATAALERLATPGAGSGVRREALFWLGVARGAEGLPTLRQTLAQETDAGMLRHAVFALGQSDAPAARTLLRDTARADRRTAVRGEALFWLAQDADMQTEALARAALSESRDGDLREKAVFALSQLPAVRAIPALEALARDRGQDPRTRREALFWLAQQQDDEALAVFDELLGDAPR